MNFKKMKKNRIILLILMPFIMGIGIIFALIDNKYLNIVQYLVASLISAAAFVLFIINAYNLRKKDFGEEEPIDNSSSNQELNELFKPKDSVETKISDDPFAKFEQVNLDDKKVKLDSIVIMDHFGRVFQCIEKDDNYYFIKLGTLTGLNMQKLLGKCHDSDAIASPEILMKGKKDFRINKADIESVNFEYGLLKNMFKMKTKNKKYIFNVYEPFNMDTYRDFFNNLPKEDIANTKKSRFDKRKELVMADDVDPIVYKRLKILMMFLNCLTISIASFLFFCIINYAFLSLSLIIIVLICIFLYIIFPKYITIMEFEGEFGRAIKRQKIFMGIGFLIASSVLGLRSIIDFNILKWNNYFIFWGIFSGALVLIFLIFTKEYRKLKLRILWIILLSILFSASIILPINYSLDSSAPYRYEAEVLSKNIYDSSDTPDEYRVKVKTIDDKIYELKISKDIYKQLETGDIIFIYEYRGFLQIAYAYIDLE